MANNFEIPWQAPDYSAPFANLITVLRHNKEERQKDEQNKLTERRLADAERRASAEEYRKQQEFERGQNDRQTQALLSAHQYDLKGDVGTADMLRKRAGITTTRETAPQFYTPAMALAAVNQTPSDTAAGPVSFEPSVSNAPAPAPVTRMNVFSHGTGPKPFSGMRPGQTEPGNIDLTDRPRVQNPDGSISTIRSLGVNLGGQEVLIPTVSEDGRVMSDEEAIAQYLRTGRHLGKYDSVESSNAAAQALHEEQAAAGNAWGRVAPPTVTQGPETGRAVADLLPMSEGDKPTGRLNFSGPLTPADVMAGRTTGANLGYFDPAEEKRMREERAGRVTGALGPMGEKYAQISALIARGDIPEAEGKALISALATEASNSQKAADKAKAAEEQRKFIQQENAKYKNEGMTVQDRKDIAEILARAKMAAAGAGPITPDIAHLVEMKVAGAGDDEIAAAAAEMKSHPDVKKFAPLVQNVVKNAAAGERAITKREGMIATDAQGNTLGEWKSPTVALKGNQMIPEYDQVQNRVQELIAHVEKYGERIDLNSQVYKDRVSLAESATAALRPYNKLSSTDASMHAERVILGPTGAFGSGWTLGANLQGLKRIMAEADRQYNARLSTMLKPQGHSTLAPSLGGPKPNANSEEGKDAAFLRKLMGQ